MFGQQNKLKELFPKYGWELTDTQTPSVWWFVEIWLIKSVWTPTDCYVFLTFEVDPQWTDRARAKFGVNKIIANTKKPVDWPTDKDSQLNKISFDEPIYLYLGRRWEKEISEFFEGLANFRKNYKN